MKIRLVITIIMTLCILGCSKTSNENSSSPSAEQKIVAEASNIEQFVSDIPINISVDEVVKKYNLKPLKENNSFVLDNCEITFQQEKGKIKYFSIGIVDKKCNFEISQLIHVKSNDVVVGKIIEDLTGINVYFTYECPPPLGCGNSAESNAIYMILEGAHVRNFESVAFEFNSDEVNEDIFNAYEAFEARKNSGKTSQEPVKTLLENNYDENFFNQWKKIKPSAVYFGYLGILGGK